MASIDVEIYYIEGADFNSIVCGLLVSVPYD